MAIAQPPAFWILIVTCIFISSCSVRQNDTDQQNGSKSMGTTEAEPLPELTQEQESAFDALNSIQVQIEDNHLYSTFPGIRHECYSPDSSFVISQTDLLIATLELMSNHCYGLSDQQRNQLATKAVLAQDEYLVLQCNKTSSQLGPGQDTPMRQAMPLTWILPNILGRRDVVLVW